jgi:hypothetical protein
MKQKFYLLSVLIDFNHCFIKFFKKGLLPFAADRYHDSHRLYMDDDPKHTSRATGLFLILKGINHWKSPPQSPVITANQIFLKIFRILSYIFVKKRILIRSKWFMFQAFIK